MPNRIEGRDPEVGQLWESMNRFRRYHFTIEKMDDRYVYAAGGKVRILRSRLRPTANGYRFIRGALGSPDG